jgi:UDP-GlcNAc:undecaprenyl-phosphate GlcNAc-1-phosphate transferase
MTFIIAFFITLIILHQSIALAFCIKLIDYPYDYKLHKKPTPMVGGIAMYCGFMLALLSFIQPISELLIFISGATILIIVGVLDDFHQLSISIRFLAQILVALLMIIGGDIVINDFGSIGFSLNNVQLGLFAEFVTIFAIIAAFNSVNMIDGIDGLAGGLTLITVSALAFISWQAGLDQSFNILLLLIPILLAFLIFNLPCLNKSGAQVFMGDAGSMFLGFIVVWFLIKLSQGEQRAMSPVTTLWIFAVPLFDIATMIIYRVLKKCSPFVGDRKHIHYIFLDLGLTVHQTLLVLFSSAIVLAGFGLVGFYLGVSETIMFWTFISLFGLYFIVYLKLVAISSKQ